MVGSAQAWMQGMPEPSSEIWQQGPVAHSGLLAPDSPAAGQKSSIQLILQRILKKSCNGLRREGGSAADLPLGSLPAHHSCSERTLYLGTSPPAGGCREVCGGPRPRGKRGMCRSPEAAGSILCQQPMAELAPAAGWLCAGTWGWGARQERDMKDGEQSRPSLGTERPASCSAGLSEPLPCQEGHSQVRFPAWYRAPAQPRNSFCITLLHVAWGPSCR